MLLMAFYRGGGDLALEGLEVAGNTLWRNLIILLLGFVSAWSLWSVTRLPVEIALIDPKPALMRYAVTFVVPPLAGMLAQAIERLC